MNTQANRILDFVGRLVEDPSTDADLVARFVRGDSDAFVSLVKRHGPMVLGLCHRMLSEQDAEDAFQATFLVFAKKARSLSRKDLVGNWLYGVAYRVASRTRRTVIQQRAREQELVDPPDKRQNEVWSDLMPVLDEEINRLPDRFRLPFVMCCLEGKTNEEAASLLGCPKGTVLSRLNTARERLSSRLSRRGITLTAGSLTALLAEKGLATVPASLLTHVITGQPVAKAVALAEGVLRTMLLTKTLRVVLLIALGAIVTGSGMLLATGDPDKPDTKKKPAPPPVTFTKTTAHDVAKAYDFNDAHADSAFTDRKIQIEGSVSRIRKVQKDTYLVMLETATASGKAIPVGVAFDLDAKEQLAPLKPYQVITVEGTCFGHTDVQGVGDIIVIGRCKLLKVGPPPDDRDPVSPMKRGPGR